MTVEIPVFIINLAQDIERKEYMKGICKQYNLQCTFENAVYGKNLSEDILSEIYNKEESIDRFGRELTKGEIGCVLSHLNIYKHIVENNIQQAIIFEDDIKIEKDFSTVVQALEYFPNDWELVLLGYHRGSARRDKEAKSYLRYKKRITNRHKMVRLAEIGTGSHGYLINLQGAKKLIKELNTIRLPMDYYTGDDQYINLYAISPRVIRVNNIFDSQSNITPDRDQLAEEYDAVFYKEKKSKYYKLRRELLRPLRQLVNYLKRVFTPVSDYK